MSTKREQIISAITTKLESISGLNVFRSRSNPVSRSKLPSAIIEPVQDVADNSPIHFNDWSLTIQVLLQVKGAIPDQEADQWISAVYEKMMEDQSLSGLTMDIQPISFENDIMEGDGANGIVILRFRVSYRTLSKNLN
jgi:hypothetical protein